jgi:hypothetical protein
VTGPNGKLALYSYAINTKVEPLAIEVESTSIHFLSRRDGPVFLGLSEHT